MAEAGSSRTSISEGGVDGTYGSVNATSASGYAAGGLSDVAAAATTTRGEATVGGGAWW